MAALQTIRSKGALLVGALGLALFAFIAEEFFRSIQTSTTVERNQVGQVFGNKLSIIDFQSMVEDQSMLYGQGANHNDQQSEYIRHNVWQQFVQNQLIESECDKLGLYVTNGEIQEALRTGNSRALMTVAQVFGNPQTGRFDLTVLQSFLKDYQKNLLLAQQSQNGEAVEQLQAQKKLWEVTEKSLHEELLANKYFQFVQQGFVSNPIAAKASYNERAISKNVEIAAVPYSTVNEKDIQVTDEDIKNIYNQYKDRFYSPVARRDVKFIDVEVKASAEDRAELMAKVQEAQQKLENSENVADIIRMSNSSVPYTKLALSKSAYSRMADVATSLDSMKVGQTKAAYYNGQDNTINTIKLIAKQQLPDSILFRQIVVFDNDAEARKAKADSIMTVLGKGSSFTALAKEMQQPTDSAWITSQQFESFGTPDEYVSLIQALYNTPNNGYKAVENSQFTIILQVLDHKHFVTKYNAAVVKCPLEFSKKTYENELSKMNHFLAENQDWASIEKNAAKNGYYVNDLPSYSSMQNPNNSLSFTIGGSQAKDCVKWILDEAKEGQVSRLYECGYNNNHLLVATVTAVNNDKYLPWNNAKVKEFLTAVVMQNKKAEKVMELAKNVKSVEDMKKLNGAVSAQLNDQVFSTNSVLPEIRVPEAAVSAAIAKTANGQTSGVIKGIAGAYVVKVNAENKSEEKFDATREMMNLGRMNANMTQGSILDYIIMYLSDYKDHRYQF